MLHKTFYIASLDVGDQVLTLRSLLRWQFTKMDHFNQVYFLFNFVQGSLECTMVG